MIREEINELFVQMHLIESKPNNTDEFIQIVTDAFTILEKLNNEYYLIPKENIDKHINFKESKHEFSKCTNHYATYSITIVKALYDDMFAFENGDINKMLHMQLIIEMERKQKNENNE